MDTREVWIAAADFFFHAVIPTAREINGEWVALFATETPARRETHFHSNAILR